MLRPARYRLIAGPTAILAALTLAACSGASGGELRGKNEALARDLCSVIGQMESGLAFGGGAESMKTLASYARELMREASRLLGNSQ